LAPHLRRIRQSARACHFRPISWGEYLLALQGFAHQHPQGLWRVALTQTADGQLSLTGSLMNDEVLLPGKDWDTHDALPTAWQQVPTAAAPSLPVALAPAANSVDACWLLHKTTQRVHYETALTAAQAAAPDVWDVILHTPDGFATECTRGNLVLQTPQGCLTPPLAQGLLPGTLREVLLQRRVLREAAIPIQRLLHPQPGDRLWFINSVRGWLPIRLVAPHLASASGGCTQPAPNQ
ncbi:MAG: aminotransferase class IV, partial [Brachymonas sp.]|nr:aminotransferase class IV [Brachymonas sp.]